MRVRYRSAARNHSRYLTRMGDAAREQRPSLGNAGTRSSAIAPTESAPRGPLASFAGAGIFPFESKAFSDWSEGAVFEPTVKPWRIASSDDALASQMGIQVRVSAPKRDFGEPPARFAQPASAESNGPTPEPTPSESAPGDAVGGGLGVATTLVASAAPAATPEAVPAATPAARPGGPLRVRPGVSKLAGSARADRIVGGPRSNEIEGHAGDDELIGGPDGDVLDGGAGNDVLDGGAGADIARFRGSVLEYELSRQSATQFTVRHARPGAGGSDGTDRVRNVERLDFRDRQVFLDGSNNVPLAQADDGLSVVDGRSLTIPFRRLLDNDVDFDGDRLTITQVKGKPADSVRIVGGTIVFTPPAGVQWALAGFTSYELPFLYTVSDGRGGTATTSATVTITRPADLRGLRTGPAGRSLEGAGGPGEPPIASLADAGSDTHSLWAASTTPTIVTDPDSVPVELGVKFVPSVDGEISGIRFYKGPQNLGTHIGNLWTATGTRLASATFTDESAGGWQQVSFTNPVPVTAGTTYVASYFAPQGQYSVDENYFAATYTNGPLTAPSSASAGGNGVYRYGSTSAFPNATFAASNYWVDVVFRSGAGNQPPVANPDSFSVAEDAVLTLAPTQLTVNDADPEDDPLTVTAVAGATNGTVHLDGGSIVFTPTANFNGAAGFTYTLSDGIGSATGTVAVAVSPVNDPPVANADSGFSTPADTALAVSFATLLANDTDVDGDLLTVDSVDAAVNGTVALDSQASRVVFTPQAGYGGPASFVYTIRDPAGATSAATVDLIVGSPANQAPIAVADSATTDEDHPVTIAVLANDSDPEGKPLVVSLVDLTGTQGTVHINADNTLTYDPAGAFESLEPGQQAVDSFTYQVTDDQGASATAPVSVTVTGVAEAPSNPIVAENRLPGTPQSVWGINGPTTAIEGFATDISVDQGQRVDFKVNTVASDYRIDIYRLGYYQGNGARYVTTVEPTSITRQPEPLRGADGPVDAGNWSVSASWNVPSDAVSGVYVAKLVREDGTFGENHMYFVVRDDDGRSDMLFQTADTTWQAYNLWGGGNFYTGTPSSPTQAHKVSYNRPFGPSTNSVNVPLFDAEYPMIRWLEANGYDVSYSTGVDTDRRGEELLEHRAFLSVGHDEYWSGQQRANVEAARDAGVHLAFFSGNEVYWKTRWEDDHRTLVSYKETWSNAKIDPSPEWTGTWRDPRFSPPSDGGRPENALTGTIFQVDSYRLDTMRIPAEDGRMRFWRDTSLANLAPGQSATLTPNVLGYEWDEAPDNGVRPAGSIRLSTTNLGVSQYLLDYGNTTGPGEATHNLTLYRAPSGALVFGAGTTRWSWGLDSDHLNESSVVDPRMQQATVNLFADMGIQPDSLAPGMVRATASTDRTAPVSSIVAPGDGSTLQVGQTVTISGTASDVGGRVGGVEVSVDNGASWHPAVGRENWSYSWRPTRSGPFVLSARAVDDSLNVQTSPATISVDVEGSSNGPWSLFGPTSVPSLVNASDPNPVELGVKFRSDVDATVTALRFYKGSQDVGPHVANLWTATGTRLATASFTNETASGWQQVDFPTPVPIEAGELYVASYHTASGFYSADVGFFASQGVDVGPLHAPASPLVAGGNGVFQYGASAFPSNTWNASNYWVDVVLASA